jgi:multidrug efflux pump subunit AcrA (membrane-fusion protein)
LVREGDRVEAGQVVARLRAPALEVRIRRAEAAVAVSELHLRLFREGARPEEIRASRSRLARAMLDHAYRSVEVGRVATLTAGGASTAAELAAGQRELADRIADERRALSELHLISAGTRPEQIAAAEAARDALVAERDALTLEAEKLVLRSPIAGTILTARVEERMSAAFSKGDLFCEVGDLDSVYAEIALLPGDPLAEVSEHAPVALRSRAAPNLEVRTRVRRLRGLVEKGQPGQPVLIAETEDFHLPLAEGVGGRARIYGRRRSIGYAWIAAPIERFFRVTLWSLF